MRNSILFSPLFLLLFSLWQANDILAGNAGSFDASLYHANTAETNAALVCDPPDYLTTYNITQTTATWDWDPVGGAVSYSVQWRYAGGTWYNLSGGPWMNTQLNVGGLQPGTDYEWRVRSNCAYGMYSVWSESSAFTTLVTSCDTPTGLATTNVTNTSATFSWSSVSGALDYSVQIRLPNGTWQYVSGSPFSNTNVTVNYLDPGTTYEWRVRTNCMNGYHSYWSQSMVFTTGGSLSCVAPDYLTTYNITQTSATWDWNSVSGAISYSVQWRYAGGTWSNLGGGPWTSSVLNVGGLQPATAYEWRVRSNCSNGSTSDWSYADYFTTLGASCYTPTPISTTNITGNSATLTWSSVSGAVSYSVQTRLPNGIWYFVPGSPFNNTSVTINNLSPGTTYEWRVRANCGNGQSSYWSSSMVFTTSGTSFCEAPSLLITTDITQTTATWDWEPVSGAVSYSVQWRHPGGTWYNLGGGPWSGTLLHIAGLQPGTDYEWRVRSNCSNGSVSEWSDAAFFTTLFPSCATPTSLATTNVTDNSATLSWDPVSGAQSYSVQLRLLNGTWYYVQGSPFNTTSVTINGLSPGSTYQWRVRANCTNGDHSYFSSYMTFTTTGTFSCLAPDVLNTLNIGSTTAVWDWSNVSGAISYSVQWRYPGDVWHDLPGGPWSNSILNIAGLQPGTAYEWRVKTNCQNGLMSDWSLAASFTTLGSSCEVPAPISTTNITNTSATFNWTSVSGALSYSVQIRVPNGTWYFIDGSPFGGTTATANNLTPGTAYEWRVRANCTNGNSSYFSFAMSFTTSGSGNNNNDNCANAMVLPVNTTCVNTVASNINAGPSLPPPAGSCWANSYKDVWFKFTMPNVSNPVVTIRTTAGSLTDAIMEVYSGSDCSNLTFIMCEDDNNNGNNSTMPVINLTGYQNQTIWVRVWGYNSSSGTFNICVFDYQSDNYSSDETGAPLDGEQITQPEWQTEPKPSLNQEPVLMVSPNPASDVLNVTYIQTEQSTVTGLVVMDISGQIVIRNEYPVRSEVEFTEQLNVSTLTPGMYVLQVRTTSGVISTKITVID